MNRWTCILLCVLLAALGCGKKEELIEHVAESPEISASTDAGEGQGQESATSEEGAVSSDDGKSEESTSSRKADGEGRKRSSKKTPPADKVNINTADAEALATVPGIGPKMADLIIEYRQSHGNFKSVDQLKGNIKGIGEKKFEKMEPYLTVK